ncbi:hypothetical protein G7Y79_00008g023180 [Physcia stellaris]|nr:hypothetical protein G7Y79_00008g023180 [Physcia stellaris]
MTAIFRDAAIPLQNLASPSSSWQSNTKRSRIPLSQARNIHFGSFYSESVREDAQADDLPDVELPEHMRSPINNSSSSFISYRKASTPPEVPCGLRFPPLPFGDSPPSLQSESAPDKEGRQVSYPSLDGWAAPSSLPRTATYDSLDEECHSTHGVPLILPVHQTHSTSSPKSSVHAWLDSVPASSTTEPSSPHDSNPQSKSPIPKSSTPPTILTSSPKRLPLKPQTPSPNSSNKENHTPKTPSSPSYSPSYSPTPVLQTTHYLSANLARFGVSLPSAPGPKSPTPDPSTPSPPSNQRSRAPSPSPHRVRSGYLSQPPKRQRARTVSNSDGGRAIPILESRPTFTIYEDEHGGEDTVRLSPGVETYRKGKGTKRERCVSYWDEDILGRGTAASDGGEEVGGRLEMVEMRNGKVVLRERVVEVDIVQRVEEEGKGKGKGERGLDGDEEGERGRERRLEFMVGKRGGGLIDG